MLKSDDGRSVVEVDPEEEGRGEEGEGEEGGGEEAEGEIAGVFKLSQYALQSLCYIVSSSVHPK